jgi:hypothetical protein
MRSGAELAAGQQLASSEVVKRMIRYEEIILDSNFQRTTPLFKPAVRALFHHFLKGNVVTRSPLSRRYKTSLQPFPNGVTVRRGFYSVVFTSNNRRYRADEGSSFSSQAQAWDYVADQVLEDPNLEGKLHVLPQEEVVA